MSYTEAKHLEIDKIPVIDITKLCDGSDPKLVSLELHKASTGLGFIYIKGHGSPKFLHFHTCGDYAPGEICWMVENHSIVIDGEPLWKDGTLVANNFIDTKDCIDKWVD